VSVGLGLIYVGRFLIGAYFLIAGIRNVFKFNLHTELLAGKNMPNTQITLAIALAAQILGGAMVAFGFWPALGALALIAFTVAATLVYHDFWNHMGEERMSHLNSVLTNLALIGGLLLVFATDWR
jgi:putative oxidoreductase